MALLYPSESVSRRWEGALEARLRRSPIEMFLRTHHLKISALGEPQLTDNIIRATIHIVEQGFTASGSAGALSRATVGTIACSICHGLTSLIREPARWRIAALVSAAELLSAGIGRKAAAFQAAATAREFAAQRQAHTVPGDVRDIGIQAALAIHTNRPDDLMRTGRLIAECLDQNPPVTLIDSEPEQNRARRPTLSLILNTDRSGAARKREPL